MHYAKQINSKSNPHGVRNKTRWCRGSRVHSRYLPICKNRTGPLPVPDPRRLLTAVTDDEQLEEVIVVLGHAGGSWLTPALCHFFAQFGVQVPCLKKKDTTPEPPISLGEITQHYRWKRFTRCRRIFFFSGVWQFCPPAASGRKLRFLLFWWWNCSRLTVIPPHCTVHSAQAPAARPPVPFNIASRFSPI